MIHIYGATGYVGREFCVYLDAYNREYRVIRARDQTRDTLNQIFKHQKPELVLNCAGYTGHPNVDACEDHRMECASGNITFPHRLAEVCYSHDVPMGHISSGCIYTGKRPDGKGFTEEDKPNFTFEQKNCSFYSGTKAMAEKYLFDFPEVWQWRLRIPFNNDMECPRNYLYKLLNYKRLLNAENSLSQINQFVVACMICVKKRFPFGIYNITNPGSVTTKRITELFNKYMVPPRDFQFFESDEAFNATVKAPRSNCVLDSSKIINLGVPLPPLEEELDKAIRIGLHYDPQ
jgi:dTDP-4-dehydrorhamnose reductase